MRSALLILIAVTAALGIAPAHAQIPRPQAHLTPSATSASVRAGGKARLSLKVTLPKDIHVQSDRPDDPALIATVLTVPAIPGVTIERIIYPAAETFQQAGRAKPLAVLGPEFVIDLHVAIGPGITEGELRIPAHLRYQACNERVCFAPTRASTEWVLTVRSR